MKNNYYDVKIFKNLSKKTFKNYWQFFNLSQFSSEIIVAVIAIIILNAFSFVFLNYNEVGNWHLTNDKSIFKQISCFEKILKMTSRFVQSISRMKFVCKKREFRHCLYMQLNWLIFEKKITLIALM